MKKFLTVLTLTALLSFFLAVNSFAAIESTADINSKITTLSQLASADLEGLVSKSELIGDRLDTFNMLTAQYQNEVNVSQERMRSIIKQIEVLRVDQNIPESEKNVQITKSYQEVTTMLYNLDSKTIQYLYSIKRIMPTISYQKYARKFKEYYNSLDITNNELK